MLKAALCQILILLFPLLLAPVSAAAAKTPDGNAERGTHWPAIIDAVKRAGITRIGDFDIEKFEDDAQEILWTGLEGAPNAVLSGDRRTAYYIWKGKKVFINDRLPADARASLAQLELHEALGATGYNDDNYALSTALNTLARLKDPGARQKLVRTYGRTIFQRRLLTLAEKEGGGASLVTRGGDLVTLFIKDQVLSAIMGDTQNSAAATPEFLSAYAKISFEPLQNRSLNQVIIQYDRYFRARPGGEAEVFSVFIPMKRWSQGASARKALIHEIIRKVTEIFPAYNGTPLVSFVPKDCPPGTKPVSFPSPSSPAARDIQDRRGALMRSCPSRMNADGGLVSDTLMAPAILNEDAPKRAGENHFACVFSYGTANYESRFSRPLGVSTVYSVQWGLVEGDYLAGNIRIDRAGNFSHIGISYRAPNAPLSPTPLQNAQSVKRASTQIIVAGQALKFNCRREN